MFKNLLKTAFRGLLKNKGFTIINIAGLALGLASCLLIIFYVVDELSYDRYNVNAARIYRVNTDIKFGGNASSYAITPPPLAAALSSFPEVDKITRLMHDVGVRIKKGNENIQEEKVAYADPNMFEVFTLPMIAGNAKTALAAPNTVVITESTAKKYFNTTEAIGQTLTVNNNLLYKVTGIMKDVPKQSHFNFDFFFSLSSKPEYKSNNWANFVVSTYVLLKPNASVKSLEAKFRPLIRKSMTSMPGSDLNMNDFEKLGNYIRMNTTPLTDIHLQSNRQYELGANSSMQYVYIFSAIALFILLLACINFMNLSTARSANRAREVGVRKVLGSPRKYLVAQFMSESVMVTLVATIIAVFAAWALLPLFNQLSGKGLAITLPMLFWLIPALTVTVLVIGVLAGSYPAFFLSAFQPIDVLKGKLSTGFKGSKLRSTLVVLQFSISIFLIIGTLVIYNQLHYIQSKDLGFNRNQVLVIKNTGILDKQAKVLQQEVRQLPGVINATLSTYLPTGKDRAPDAMFTRPALTPKSAMFCEIWTVDENYIPTMGMKMAAGRNFLKDFQTDSTGILINEAAAKMLGYVNDPLSKKLYAPSPKGPKAYQVLGVVKDFNFSSLRENITPVVMVLSPDYGVLSIRTSTTNFPALVAQVEQRFKNLSPGEHFDYSFMDEDFDAAYRTEQRTGTILLAFTTLAIIIACLGLFGLTAYAAEQRNREIGIRKVLGAEVSTIVAMLSKDFIRLVAISIIVATPLAWLVMQKWLQGYAYRQNVQWWVLVVAGLGALLIAFITISFNSIKAALSNPVNSLRSE